MTDAQDKLFSNFKEHSVAEFFKKNKQMLGFSGKIRSLTTIIHELVSNSLDAAEEANILPELTIHVKELGEDHYLITVEDNGPGIPKTHLGKALGQMLAGTKFHRYVQQRGQQGIGAAGCTMYSLLTTGKHPRVISYYKGKKISCEISIDFKTNHAELINLTEEDAPGKSGLTYEAEFKDVKYERSNHGVYEYLRRTALANPHTKISLIEPSMEIVVFPRSIESNPMRPKEIKPHPLGIGTHDLLDLAKSQKEYKKLGSFLQNCLTRVSANKVTELSTLAPDVNFNKNPNDLTWEEAEQVVQAFKKVKWIAPETDSIVPIGKEQIEKSFVNIFNPEFLVVSERAPKIYKGGVPFMVETAIAYGGGVVDAGKKGEVMRFANRVPLLFDGGGCAITESVRNIEWSRYDLKAFEEEPIVLLVNLVSVHVPYTGAGKQAISNEEDVLYEIKNAIMESSRLIQRHISGKRRVHEMEGKKKAIARYIQQLTNDLTELLSIKGKEKKEEIKNKLTKIVTQKYSLFDKDEEAKENPKFKESAKDEEEVEE